LSDQIPEKRAIGLPGGRQGEKGIAVDLGKEGAEHRRVSAVGVKRVRVENGKKKKKGRNDAVSLVKKGKMETETLGKVCSQARNEKGYKRKKRGCLRRPAVPRIRPARPIR